MDVVQLGKAFAWEHYGRWYYSVFKEMAPPGAIEVDRYAHDGQILLHHDQGQHGRFIRGAEQVR